MSQTFAHGDDNLLTCGWVDEEQKMEYIGYCFVD